MTVLLSLDIPAESYLVLYPHAGRSGSAPDAGLTPEIRIPDRPGDVVIFPGAEMWHLRRHPANAMTLSISVS
jgi:hypothetical protein